MSQLKIIKQDIINSLKTNLSITNINYLISELKSRILINFNIDISEKHYMW